MGFDYSSRNKRWQAVRKLALKRDGYLCRESARYGKIVEANVVHHIWPAEDYPEYAYELWNLLSLCQAQHDAMHDRVTRALTSLGERWRRRTIPLLRPSLAAPDDRSGKTSHTQGDFFRRVEFWGGPAKRSVGRARRLSRLRRSSGTRPGGAGAQRRGKARTWSRRQNIVAGGSVPGGWRGLTLTVRPG